MGNIRIREDKTAERGHMFDEVPRLTLKVRLIDVLLSHWKVVLFIIFAAVACCLFWPESEGSAPDSRQHEESAEAPHTSLADRQIEGIYYGQYDDSRNGEPLPASVTLSSNGVNHYLLSAQGQVFEFYLDRETGVLTSSALGEGRLSIDQSTGEIIIKFKGWTFKH